MRRGEPLLRSRPLGDGAAVKYKCRLKLATRLKYLPSAHRMKLT